MASVKKYETAKGYAWRVQYRSPDGKSRTKQGFRTKTEAQAWADKNAVNTREGSWIDPALGKATIGDLAETWKQSWAHLKPATKSINESTWRMHVQPAWARDKSVPSANPKSKYSWVQSPATPREKTQNPPMNLLHQRQCGTVTWCSHKSWI